MKWDEAKLRPIQRRFRSDQRERRRPNTYNAGGRKSNRKKDEGTPPRGIDRMGDRRCIPPRQPKVDHQANDNETSHQGRNPPTLQCHGQSAKTQVCMRLL